MNPKLPLGLALVLGGTLIGDSQTNGTVLPVVPAPAMHQCREAKARDLGVWDDALRFADQDGIVLRKQNSLFSYSLVTGRLKEIHVTNSLAGVRLIDGMTWQKHQWVFCQSATAMPFAVDLADGKTATFEIPGVIAHGLNGPDIHAIINAGAGAETIVAITGDEATNWPREGNRPLYFWMSLESGKVRPFPAGWDLNYFSADQKRAVFAGISTNSEMYPPWVTVDMATGDVTGKLPDQTKERWSSMLGFWQVGYHPWENYDYHRHVWELRSPRTEMKLLHPQPGRGFIDDKFAGLSVNGVEFTLGTTDANINNRCVDAKSAGSLAAFSLQPDGASVENSFWVMRLGKNEKPILVATNCRDFEMLGDQRCALLLRNPYSSTAPEVFVYDAGLNRVWNVLEGVSPKTNATSAVGDRTNQSGMAWPRPERGINGWPPVASGMAPMTVCRLIPGFGSARYPAKVLCLCSTTGIVPDYMIPPPVQKAQILLTEQGRRYQIHLPPELREAPLDDAWLHNSGKLVINNSGHIYVVDLRAN